MNFPYCFVSDTTIELERHRELYLIKRKEKAHDYKCSDYVEMFLSV